MSRDLENFREFFDQDARLCILKALAGETNYRLNDSLLTAMLTEFAIDKGRPYVRNQLRWLEETADAVRTVERGSVLIAELTQSGLDHVERRTVLDGVKRPAPVGG